MKQCPFCGSETVSEFYVEEDLAKFWGVTCKQCPAQIEADYDSVDKAVQAWDKRVNPWIKVSDRLPEPGRVVILFKPSSRCQVIGIMSLSDHQWITGEHAMSFSNDYFSHWHYAEPNPAMDNPKYLTDEELQQITRS
jgi:hypothetical protein